MAERPSRVNLQPTEEDWELIDVAREFDGGDVPGVYKAGLRARIREIELLKDVLKNAAPVAPKPRGKGIARRKR